MQPGEPTKPDDTQDALKLWEAVLTSISAKCVTDRPMLVVLSHPPPFAQTTDWIKLLQKFTKQLVFLPILAADPTFATPLCKRCEALQAVCIPMYSHETGIHHALNQAWAQCLPQAAIRLTLGQPDLQSEQLFAAPTSIVTQNSGRGDGTSLLGWAAQGGGTVPLVALQQAHVKKLS